MKTFCFTVDDNIWCLSDLTKKQPDSLFDNAYLAVYKRLHEKFGVKVQLNLFYETEGFTLSQMTEKYKSEWEANADWLKLSFHSREYESRTYGEDGYSTLFDDASVVNAEIVRFAGERSLAKTTTIHFCKCSDEGQRALADCGYLGLLGLYGTDEQPRISYGLDEGACYRLRRGEGVTANGIRYFGIDVVLNAFSIAEILEKLQGLSDRTQIRVMIHEQFFYPHYRLYQPEFEEKLSATLQWLTNRGFVSAFAEEWL